MSPGALTGLSAWARSCTISGWRSSSSPVAGSWLVTYAVLLVQLPDPSVVVTALSLLYVAYYAAASVVLTLRR